MNEKRLQAELWETQMWLMLILSLGLYETGHSVLFWIPLVWAGITFMGTIIRAAQARV